MGPSDLPTLLAGPAEVVPADGLEHKLALGRPLRVKLGLDPTAPSVTLGWAVVLRKLRQFQDLGHIAVLIVGDFTARVGDPSGKTETRPRLSKDEVDAYAERLLEQFWLILDRERTELRRNSEWLEGLSMEDVLRLAASTTVAQMLEREDFSARYADGKPISMMEFLYPLLQGYDSVATRADVELGGSDQLFNLLVARDLQREHGQDEQIALTVPLLVGIDGVQKMSQSLDNYVGITESPDDMFGKLVRVSDELIVEYRRLTLDFFRDPEEPERVAAGLADGTRDPWTEKRRMAREVVDLYHGPGAGERAEAHFLRVHREGRLPDEIPDIVVPRATAFAQKGSAIRVLDHVGVLVALGLVRSKSEARRLIDQRGARCDGREVATYDGRWDGPDDALIGSVWQVGKRRFARVSGISDESPTPA
ncbi:MAG TPA: tyrosine--tRNA ligase [Actinomycetota bacterium]|nr:tyrosine--tRNA ligase [Actinomycetota bacterium]